MIYSITTITISPRIVDTAVFGDRVSALESLGQMTRLVTNGDANRAVRLAKKKGGYLAKNGTVIKFHGHIGITARGKKRRTK